jgi:DNA-3-methyladenine glycosylase II
VSTFQLIPRGAFSLTASTRFLEGFAPARYRGGTIEPGDVRLRLAFPVEGSWRTAGVVVTQAADGTVHADVHGVELPRLREQLARIFRWTSTPAAWTPRGPATPSSTSS